MALNDFKEVFSDRYQDIISKSLVAMKVANTRLQAGLKEGDTVHRFILNLSAVLVRDVTNLTDQTIDPITDSDQYLTVDQKKGAAFPIAHWEEVQAGSLDPASTAGKEIGLKVSSYVDASVLNHAVNMTRDFDTGDLTTMASTGVPIVLSTTNVPQFLTKIKSKLKRNNAGLTNLVMVIDPDTMAIFEQTLIGKNIDAAGNALLNGFSGNMGGFTIYESNNLTGQAVLYMATAPTAAEIVTINGVACTFVAALTGVAGQVLIGTADATRANLTHLLNNPSVTNTEHVAFAAADIITITELRITAVNDNAADTMTIVCIGSGRLTLTENFVAGADLWQRNYVHALAGRSGSIDVVIQDGVKPVMLREAKQDTMNILTNTLYGIRTFDDGAVQMLDVLIDVTSA